MKNCQQIIDNQYFVCFEYHRNVTKISHNVTEIDVVLVYACYLPVFSVLSFCLKKKGPKKSKFLANGALLLKLRRQAGRLPKRALTIAIGTVVVGEVYKAGPKAGVMMERASFMMSVVLIAVVVSAGEKKGKFW